MNNIIFDFISYYVIAILLIVIILVLMQSLNKKRLKREIEKLERDKNTIIDSPIMSELSKVECLIKNDSIKCKYEYWQGRIDKIKGEMITEITDLLLEADFLIDQKNYNEYKQTKIKIELKIYEAYENKNRLIEEIQEITLCEDKNRTLITELKARYRDILQNFESSSNDFGELKDVVKLQIENIEKRFQDFETLLEKQEYEEINHIMKALDSLIEHMETVMEELPSAILMATNLIPKRIEEIMLNYNKLKKEGYQLDYLNIEYNIEEVNKKIENIMSKTRVLNLEDVVFELKTIIEYFDSVFNDFEREKMAKKSFDDQVVSFKSRVNRINDSMNRLYGNVVDAKYNYKLTKEQLAKLDELSEELEIINKDFDVLYETKEAASFPYSRLIKELEILTLRLSKLDDKLDKYVEAVGNMQDDEKRAREQLMEISAILKDTKYKIREYKFPTIPNNYFVEMQEATDGVKEISKELEKKPINIDVLNTRVDTARDLVFKFSNTTNELLKTVSMAEKAIIYGNRYRSNRQYIEDGLEKAEMLFYKGDYKKSLEITLNTIDSVEPGIHKKLLELYEKN